MKLPVLSVAAIITLGSNSGLLAQGRFRPDNYSHPSGPNPIAATLREQDGVTPLAGPDYSAQYYAGPLNTVEEALTAIPPVFPLTGKPGVISGAPVTVDSVAPGQQARLQLRVWDNEHGTNPTWESARVRGASPAFNSPPLSPPNAPATVLHGLTGAQLTPAISYRAPQAGDTHKLYQNTNAAGLSLTTTHRSLFAFAADGLAAFLRVVPGPATEPFWGPVEARWRRGGGEVSFRSPVPVPADPYQWSIAGTSDDGLTIVGNYFDGASHAPRLVRNGVAQPVPGDLALGLSGNGQFVLLFGKAGNLERHDWRTGESVELRPARDTFLLGEFQLSWDGRTALLRDHLWREGSGNLIPVGGLYPRRLSGDGRVIVGQAGSRPAIWTADRGLSVLHDEHPWGVGDLNDCSFDGSIVGGRDDTRRGRRHVWRRVGTEYRPYRLAELLPNGAHKRLADYSSLEVRRVSRDGRTLFVIGEDFRPSFLTAANPADSGLIAHIVFPDDGARLTLQPGVGPGGSDQLTLPAPTGFRFQLERSSGLDAWTPVGAAVAGNGTFLSFELPAKSEVGFYRVQTTPE